jgi:predicted nucleic acid-binding protein
MARICVDACFLIGLYDRDDQHHGVATRHFDALFGEKSSRCQLVVPWPILYECLGTRHARGPRKSILFKQHWNYLYESDRLVLLNDGTFRRQRLDEHLQDRSRRGLSLVDRVLRSMILDRRRLFDSFLTYNERDFEDACQIGHIRLIGQKPPLVSYGF